MLFGAARARRGWFATHPPLVERISALEPGFDPRDSARDGGDRAAPLPEAAPRAAARVRRQASRSSRPRRSTPRSSERARSSTPEIGGALRAALPEEL